MKLYTITRITDTNGNDRLDGRYPIRIGRRGKLILNGIGYMMIFDYRARENEDYQGYLKTSIVINQEIVSENGVNTIKVTTLNSIYYLQQSEN